ncbi:hypothetical protein Tsubulata_031624 [Turnera subulata]|uniref:Protein kinase domain-containing protein n=1 Tax=Turnera subulata TaxID=218843 RepID=A0A9Q0FDW9_9ROSI|nr:hypothetical protein Tsubulata_031624 [Turnera subulata]
MQLMITTTTTTTLLVIVTTLLLHNHALFSSSLTTDGLALLALKAAITADPTDALASWRDTDSTPCHWHGVTCTHLQRVTSLSLPGKNLTGYLPSELGLLDSLSRLTLSGNNFSRPIPSHLFSPPGLRSLDLSRNSLSGPIPPKIQSLHHLTHLDLSSNRLNGSLPECLVTLKTLSGTLNLSFNDFSGEIPVSYGWFPVLVSLDLRHNNLSGKVPQVGSLVNQGPTAFAGNPGLCGFPLQIPCPEAVSISVPAGEQNPENPRDSIPASLPGEGKKAAKKTGSVAVPLISGVSLVVGAVWVSVWVFRRKRKGGSEKGKTGRKEEGDFNCGMEMDDGANGEGQKGKFMVVDEGFNLELEDLLRASAYVVGKSRSGIVYKVVVGGGSGAVVAVRRLSEGDNATWKLKEFESEVEAIGRVHHPNIVRLKACYYAHDEKLLISDFLRNGSLHSALHDGPSNSLSPLAWATRLKIAQGTARGLMYIHECSPRKYVHGNLKSTKILLDDELRPYISGLGLTRLVSGASRFSTSASKKQYLNQAIVNTSMGLKVLAPLNMHLAPEARTSYSKSSQKCDVYSFGIILMELLTGRLPDAAPESNDKGLENLVRKVFREERPLSEIIDPALVSEIHAKKQVVAMFHIALNCTELDPELRPRMRTVSESLDRIKLE